LIYSLLGFWFWIWVIGSGRLCPHSPSGN
jgi:hypothetical protein